MGKHAGGVVISPTKLPILLLYCDAEEITPLQI